MLPFKIVLGGDSRKSRTEIDDKQEDFYRELEDADREELGFMPLSQYSDYLQENLSDSTMAQAILDLFDQYNAVSLSYEEIENMYDEICVLANSEMEEDEARAFIATFPFDKSIPMAYTKKSTNEILDEIREWLAGKYESVSKITENKLPDYIEYGENIRIIGTDCKNYTLSLDELHGMPEAGSEEQIEVSLFSGKETIAKGYVKLTVGYLSFDEDGGAADGIEDSIEYEVDDVLNALKKVILDLKGELGKEQELVSFLANCLKQKND